MDANLLLETILRIFEFILNLLVLPVEDFTGKEYIFNKHLGMRDVIKSLMSTSVSKYRFPKFLFLTSMSKHRRFQA